MSRYRSEESRQKARQSIMRTLSDRSRKVREYDKLAQDRAVLLALVREGIECGGSTRMFLRWVERAKFIIANEPPASAQETPAECTCNDYPGADEFCTAHKADDRRAAYGFTQEQWAAMPCAGRLHNTETEFHTPDQPCPLPPLNRGQAL